MASLLTLVSVSGLWDAALKSAAVVLLAVVVATALGRASAAWRHLVWTLSVAMLLLLPVLALVLPDWRIAWLPQWIARPTHWTAQPTQLTVIGQADLAPANRARPHDNTAPLDDAAIVLPPSAAVSKKGPYQESHRLPPATLEVNTPARAAMPWPMIVWAAGGLLSLVPLAVGLWQLAGLHRRSQVIGDRRWLTLLDELRRQLAVRRRVQLRQCRSSLAPLTWGALRPVLLVPFEARVWPDRRRRLVLLHELAHVRRWDWLTQLVAHVACAVYWFNPLVWLAARQMRIERERACDDIVLACGARPSDYARELLGLAARMSPSQLSTLAAVPMARRGALDDRLRGILDSRRSRSALTRAAVCLGTALAAAALAPLAMLRAAPPESAETIAGEQGTGNGEQRIGSSRAAPAELAEWEVAELKKKPPAAPNETLEMTVNTSRILSIGKPLPRAHVSNPDVAEITALSPTQIQIMAKYPGVTQVHLFDEDDTVYSIDAVIYPDARKLRLSLRTKPPMDPVPVGRQVEKVDDDHGPPELGNHEVKEIWDVTLEEAVRSALTNSKVLRNMGGRLFTPVASPSNPGIFAGQGAKGSAPDSSPKTIRGTKVRFVVARTNDDIALADFQSGVRVIVSDVERAYWDLYYNYRNLNAVQAGRDEALAAWRKVYALQEVKGGEAKNEKQAHEQYAMFRAQVENTLGLLHTTESRLRYIMGLAPTDGRLIRPADEPTTEQVRFDWKEILADALNRGVELPQEQELELVRVLTNSIRDLDRNYQVSRTTFNRRVAAQAQVEAVQSAYDTGRATIDMLLDAQRRLADAEIAYYRALVDYNVAILQVHYRKNSLLEYNGILLTEGARAGLDVRAK